MIYIVPLLFLVAHFIACKMLLGGGAAYIEPETDAVSIPKPTKPVNKLYFIYYLQFLSLHFQ